jgi:hypothetical protein
MGKPLGTRAVEKGIVSTEELRKALQRQQMFGGKLGYNMVSLGYMSDPELAGLLQFFPEPPKDVAETKLDEDFISDLILKHALYIKSFTIPLLSEKTRLPESVISQCVAQLRHNRLTEITKADPSFSFREYEYRITDAGLRRALNLMEENKYVGPAPVVLEDYSYAV